MPDDGECRIVSTTYPKSPLKKGSLSGKQNQAVTDAACGGFLVGGEQDNFTGFSEGIQNAEFCHYLCAEDGARAQPGETEEVLSKCKLDGKRNQPDLPAGFLQWAVEARCGQRKYLPELFCRIRHSATGECRLDAGPCRSEPVGGIHTCDDLFGEKRGIGSQRVQVDRFAVPVGLPAPVRFAPSAKAVCQRPAAAAEVADQPVDLSALDSAGHRWERIEDRLTASLSVSAAVGTAGNLFQDDFVNHGSVTSGLFGFTFFIIP